MAEGGDKTAENPFSFQTFVKKKDKSGNDIGENDSLDDSEDDLPDDIFESAEVSRAKATKPVKNPVVIPDGEFDPSAAQTQRKKENKKPARREENPFSFKKFLKKDPVSSTGRPAYSNHANEGSSGPAPDFANDLPDFVQDHFSGDHQRPRSTGSRNRPRTHSDVSLPDFALDTSASPKDTTIFPSINAIGNLINNRDDLPRPSSASRTIGLSNGILDNDLHTGTSPRHVGLPDFLSDSVGLGADGSNGASNVIRREVSPLIGTEDLSGEIKRLQEENKVLRQQLAESRDFAERESKRVTGVLAEMQVLQKRESEETAALENMVQQVEANLLISTKRAVKAENTITKLKQEMKSLQGQVTSLSAENQALRSGDPYLEDMRDKTQYIAQQLSGAAQNADQSLRQLLGGVTNLQLMSDILLNIGKLTEEHEQSEQEPQAEPSPPPNTNSQKQEKSPPATGQQKTASSPGTKKSTSKASGSTGKAAPNAQRKDTAASPNKSKSTKAQTKKDSPQT